MFAIALAVLVIPPAGSALAAYAPSAGNPSACPNAQTASGVVANVTWNGTNICTAGSPSAALVIVFTQNAHVVFNWTAAGRQPVPVTDARLAMNYFGFAIATRDVGPINPVGVQGSPAGSFEMDWNPGALTYLLAGLYSVTASLFASNGSVVWSDTFFVKASAPYTLLAALPILLIVIAAIELYEVARSGRFAVMGRKPPTGGPASPPTTSPESPETSSPAPTPEPTENAPPKEGG